MWGEFLCVVLTLLQWMHTAADTERSTRSEKSSFAPRHKEEKDVRGQHPADRDSEKERREKKGPVLKVLGNEPQTGKASVTTQATLSGGHAGQALCLSLHTRVAHHGARPSETRAGGTVNSMVLLV